MYRLYIAGLWIALMSILFPFWPLELLVSFLLYVAVIGAALFIFFTARQPRRNPSIAWVIIPLVILWVLPIQSWVANTSPVIGENTLTLLTHNMLYSSDNAEAVADQARNAGADVIALQEALPEQIEAIRTELGFSDMYMSDCNCSVNNDELALISRYPVVDAETINVDVRGGQIISVLLDIEGRFVRTFVVHLPVPIVPSTYATRERGFARLTELISDSKEPVIAMGDFNTTQWSPTLRKFSAAHPYLHNVINEGSSAVTWCDRFIGIACLRIDHVFVDESIDILSSEVGESAGSDHKAVVTKIRL